MNAVTDFDLGPLTWVKGEIDLALERAAEALQQFRTQGDATQFKFCRTHIHQVHGALSVVGLDGVTQITETLEALLATLEEGKIAPPEPALPPAEAAIQALRQYLDDLLAGEPNQPLRLLPVYRSLCAAQGIPAASPTDLFFPDLGLRPPKRPAGVPMTQEERQKLIRSERVRFQRGLLAWLRQPEGSAASRDGLTLMQEALRRIEATQISPSSRAFWWAALGLVTALAHGASQAGDARSLCARVDLQIRRLLEGNPGVAERLLRDSLYFVAHTPSDADPLLAEIQGTYHLDNLIPAAGQGQGIGQPPQEAVLRRLRETIATAEEQWNRFCAGSATALTAFVDHTRGSAQLASELEHEDLKRLAQALMATANWLSLDPTRQSDGVAMEIATALLLVQTSLDNYSRLGQDFAKQVDLMAARLHACMAGETPADEDVPLLDEMTRRAQERLLMAQVAREIQNNLAQIEQILDAYFRDTNKRPEASTLEGPLRQISGALTILGQDAAVQFLGDCEQHIRAFTHTDAVPEAGMFETVAQQLSTLGFFIDALQHGNVDFHEFLKQLQQDGESATDTEEEEFSLEEQPDEPPVVSVESQLERLKSETRDLLAAIKTQPGDQALRDDLQAHLQALQKDADLVADQALVNQAKAALAALADKTREAPAMEAVVEALAPMSSKSEAPAPSEETLLLAQASTDELDAELLAIFLEEATEVLATIGTNLETLRQQPHNTETLTTIRRSAHTLKGSGRMVGLKDLGETAWAVEQTLNLWLRQEQEVTSELLDMISLAHQIFTVWVVHLESGDGLVPDPQPLVTLAERLRGEENATPPTPPAPQPPSPPEPAPEAQEIEMEFNLEEPSPQAEDEVRDELDTPEAELSADLLASRFDLAPLESLGDETPVTAAEPELEQAPASEPAPLDALEGLEIAFDLDEEEAADVPAIDPTPEVLLEAESPDAAPEESTSVPEPASLDALEDLEISFDLDTEESPEAPAIESLPESSPEIVLEEDAQDPVSDLPETLEMDAEAEPEISVEMDLAFPEESADLPQEEMPGSQSEVESDSENGPEVVVAAAEAPALPETQILTISPQLYEIFRDEARGHLDNLQVFLKELEKAPAMPTPFEVGRAAHTLAGIAGTVGILPVNKLGKALEHALLRRDASQQPDSVEGQEVLRQTLDMLEAMLLQLSNGHMPEAQPALIEALGQTYAPKQDTGASSAQEKDLAAVLGDKLDPPAEPEPVPAEPQDASPEEQAVQAATAPQAEMPPLLQDELDDQLLPIFLEEAQELCDGFQTQISAWQTNPEGEEAPHALARLLHTFKGSARMAGAMNLGQLTHAVESRVSELQRQGSASADDLDEIANACDVLAQTVERYLAGDYSLPSQTASAPQESNTATPGDTVAAPQASVAPQNSTTQAPAPVHTATVAEHAENEPGQKAQLRVRADLVDQLVNEAGELSIARTRIEGEMRELKDSLLDLTENVIRLRRQLREIEIQAETQIQANTSHESKADFDPLELDRFTRFQELTRMMAESVNDVSTVQQNLLKNLDDANAAITAQARLNRSLQQSLMSVRMVPFASQNERLYRLVRQTAKEVGKRANLEISGGQVELDRSVLEKVLSPLEHMLRNAVAHGLETREQRLAAGKEEIGEVSLSLAQEGNEIILSLADDGSGLNLKRIREKAEAAGLIAPGEQVDDKHLVDFIFHSGFSTAAEVSQVAGRGVGMDVVKTEITALGGRIEINTHPGQGTTFRLYLPLTLAVTQTVMVQVAERLYAIPSAMIEQVMEVRENVLDEMQQKGEAVWQGNTYPFHYLPRLLADNHTQPEHRRLHWVLLLRSGAQRVAVLVDEMRGNQEIVVKNVGPQMARVVGIAGATVLGDGQVMLILNPVALASRLPSVSTNIEGATEQEVPQAPAVVQQPTVLVVDDSLTVRKITSKLLAREGYLVELAKDGVDALEQLIDKIPDVILSDIEMPRMDGFDLVRNIRADERLINVPIIMITSRTADKHRNYAMEIGANHYLGKPYDEEELLRLLAGYTGRA